MRILQIPNYYFPHIGGIEQVAGDISSALQGLHEVKVFCFNHGKGDACDTVNGTEVIRAGCFAKVASQSMSFSYYKNLKKLFKSFKPQAVIFHYPNPFGAHYLLKLLKKYPQCKLVIYWHLDIVKQKLLGKLFGGQTKRLLKRAVKVMATSPNYIEGSKYLSANREKCTVVSCCVNTERMEVSPENRLAAEKIKSENAGKTILFAIGRHVPYKGIEYLVRASRLLDDSYKIYIGGKGELTESLKELAKGDKKIEFKGVMETEDLKAHLLACDIFCFPSITKNEAFGIALAEAMYLGKPAVTFNIEGSGVNYVSLNGVTGLEAENRNVEEYAKAIAALAEDETLREKYGAAARERVLKLFTQDIFKAKIIEIAEELQRDVQ